MHFSGLMTSRQGSTSTFYNCCWAIPFVTLGDTEAGNRPRTTTPWIHLYSLVRLMGGVLNPLHMYTIRFCNTVSKSPQQGPGLLLCPGNSMVAQPVATVTEEFTELSP